MYFTNNFSRLLTKRVGYARFRYNLTRSPTNTIDALYFHTRTSIKADKESHRDHGNTNKTDLASKRNPFGPTPHYSGRLPSVTNGRNCARGDIGLLYLEKMFDYTPKMWIKLTKMAKDRDTFMTLLTNFQRHLRGLKGKEVLELLERIRYYEIRENNEDIDVYHVIMCELAYRLTRENLRHFSILEISRLCKIFGKIKFNKEPNKNESLIPVCAENYRKTKIYELCENCKLRYGDLATQNGNDLMTILIVSFGKSILAQLKSIRKLHENLIIPYLSLVGSRNCTGCSHIVRELCIRCHKCFMSTYSLINIAILLHTIKRTRARANFIFRNIAKRLVKDNGIEDLCSKEFVTKAQSVALSQLIISCISSEYRPSEDNRRIDALLYRILVYVEKTFSNLLKYDTDDKYSYFITQLNLLNKACIVERHRLHSKIMANQQLSDFINSIPNSTRFDEAYDFKTSTTHLQVRNTLDMFNYETEVETKVYPYIVDILVKSKNLIIEVDGPYHYTTYINKSVGKILNRESSDDLFQHTLNSRLKQRLLQKSGYKFVNIPYYKWPNTTSAQVYFIASLGL
ncbi:conserved hypothetical protein [Theileria equi strain WA]|uniref:RAP domain-containing protein n=1 Tax=Theileria equi strain WA TaxID=1537102 RepID=L1LG12_THEEQ|nr:conserved hypothetical protein [Theileria equi strain WA]EKX74209.1 conserved hypothetical protein [Theileria equi strain WA]|eukprot:XP_004833661.1 conserved hypothetical protein [Theileria equi strain WA]